MKHALHFAALLFATSLLAQGPLTPPPHFTNDPTLGSPEPIGYFQNPEPTMKTLHQVEPRTPLVVGSPGVTVQPNGGFTITAPGSYYLTQDLAVTSGDGILIAASQVTLDLRGFAISSSAAAPGSGSGVLIASPVSGTMVAHGRIAGSATAGSPSGFLTGVLVSSGGATVFHRVEDVIVTGCAGMGIDSLGLVRGCQAIGNGSHGIRAQQIVDCLASGNGGVGLSATFLVRGSTAKSNESDGIQAAVAWECRAEDNGQSGFNFQIYNAVWRHCSAAYNYLGGFHADEASIEGCQSYSWRDVGFESFTLTRAVVRSSAATDGSRHGFRLSAGVIADSTATGNYGEGFKLRDCVGSNLTSFDNVSSDGQAGISNWWGCLVNSTSYANSRGGIYLVGGVIMNCRIRDHTNGLGTYGLLTSIGLVDGAGVVAHCSVTGNAEGMFIDGQNVSFCFSRNNEPITNYYPGYAGWTTFQNR